MKRYRIILDHINWRYDEAFFRIECSNDGGQTWTRIGKDTDTYRPLTAKKLVEDIINGEREYILVPVQVTTVKSS